MRICVYPGWASRAMASDEEEWAADEVGDATRQRPVRDGGSRELVSCRRGALSSASSEPPRASISSTADDVVSDGPPLSRWRG